MASENRDLKRTLTLLDVTMVGVAAMIGGAIFVLVGPGIAAAGPALMLAFLINGIITIFTAFTYAELSSAIPDTGGGYRWVREGLPRPNAFLSGWMSWFAHTIAGSLYAVAFAAFLVSLLQTAGIIDDGMFYQKLFAAISIIVLTFVNIRGTSPTSKVGNVVTFTQLTIIAILIISALIAIVFVNPNWQQNLDAFFPNGTTGLLIAMGLTFIAFEGYEVIAQTGNELKNPKKNIPRAIFISIGAVVAVYILFTFVFIAGLNEENLGEKAWMFIGKSGELGILEASKNFLPYGGLLVLAGGLVSTLAALNATTYSSSRVSYAMGKNYNLPGMFGRIHPTYKTPTTATLFSGAIMLIVALSFDLTDIAFAASVMFLFLFCQVNYASITIRHMYSSRLHYEFKTPLFPLIPILGILSTTGLAVYLLFSQPLSWIIAIIWIIAGFVVYKKYTAKKEIEHYSPLVLNEEPKKRGDYRIMILYHPNYIMEFLDVAKALSKEKQGEIVFLNIAHMPVHVPLSVSNKIVQSDLKEFDDLKNDLPNPHDYHYIVRASHDITETILLTADEQGVNLIITTFSFLHNNRKLLSLSTCDFIGIRPGRNIKKDMQNLVVAYDKGRHSDLGLRIANSLSKSYDCNIRLVRGVLESPEEELRAMNRINELMFDLEMKKTPFEKIYPKSKDVSKSLLENFAKFENETIVLGAGNQADQAFSPITMSILDETRKTVFVIRDHRFSEFHARTFWRIASTRISSNKYLFKLYSKLIQVFYGIRRPAHYDDKYFDSKAKPRE